MPIRITGMNSGMDIDKLVSDLMRAERMPLDKLQQKKQTLSWKTDLYREINTKVAAFRDLLSGLRFSSSMSLTKATSSDPSKVTAVSNNGASAISHTVGVSSLASGAVVSSGLVSNVGLIGNNVTGTTTITDAGAPNNKFNVTLDGVTRTITLANGSYDETQLKNEVQSKIDSTFGSNRITVNLSGGSLELTPVGTAGSLPQIIMGTVTGNDGLTAIGFTDQQSYKMNINEKLSSSFDKFAVPLAVPAGTDSFMVNGQVISYTQNDTLATIMNKVNSSAAGVNMSYDSISDKITFTSKQTGIASQVKLENGASGNFLAAIGIASGTQDLGEDAQVTIDGVISSRSTNTFLLDGVTYTLNAETTSDISVNVVKDTDAIIDQITEFVNGYNDLVVSLNQKRIETVNRNYLPLTDEQKSSMSEKDIELWEKKAKSGLLHNDSLLAETGKTLRSFMVTKVTGISTAFNSLAKVGITTEKFVSGGYNPLTAGKITLDEDKLREALNQDTDGVIKLFTNQSTVASEKGIAQAMYEKMNDSINSLVKKAGRVDGPLLDVTTDLGLQLNKLEKNIFDFEDRVVRREDYYYKQFSLMEQAIQNSNAQLSWLSQQFM